MSEVREKNYRFVGNVKKYDGPSGSFTKIQFDSPTDKVGEPNKFFTGHMIFIDAVTGDQYRVKQISMINPTENMRSHGMIHSLSIDLNDSYCVEKLT